MNNCTLSCSPCREGGQSATEEELKDFMLQVEGWEIAEGISGRGLAKVFKFSNFSIAMNFANSLARLAEREGHHPVIEVAWGRARVLWMTNKIKNIHLNDMIMAMKTEQLYRLT